MTQQEKDIIRWLGLFMEPGQITELRALHVNGVDALRSFYNTESLHALALQAIEWEMAGAKGVYFIPNPLRPEMLRSVRCANDDDVTARRWLLIDIDSTRPSTKEPATDAERHASWDVVEHVRELLAPRGLVNPVVGDSGNGWHLNYAIRMPNDEAHRQWARQLLYWLKANVDLTKGLIDTSTHNASRIWKLYGTRAQKGTATADRPHRWSRIVEE